MKFAPKSNEQLDTEEKERREKYLWPVGEYGFEILEQAMLYGKLAETFDTKSKKGNDMIVLVVQVFNDKGDSLILADYLLEAMAYKLRHAAEACGLLAKYEAGELHAADFIGKTGKLILEIAKNQDPKYPDKNGVKDYIAVEGDGIPAAVKNKRAGKKSKTDPQAPLEDDSAIPF